MRRNLLRWYRRTARDLPWRRTLDPYAIWVSEIMLQQTRVEYVVPYYERFLATFPTVHALAAATEDQVVKLWEGLGYYRRVHHLHRAAEYIVEQCCGQFPRTAAALQRLPGVGRYTAGAIASIAFGERSPVLDGNVKRVLARVFHVSECIDDARTEKRLWTLAASLIPAKQPGDFNQGLMELGARICLPRAPRCAACPLRGQCQARSRGARSALPVRRMRREPPRQEMLVAVIRNRGRFLLGQRPPRGLLSGLWEFPAVEMQSGASPRKTLRHEIRARLGVDVRVGSEIGTVAHAYSHVRLVLHVYPCELRGGTPASAYYTDLKWVFRMQIPRYALSKANHKILEIV